MPSKPTAGTAIDFSHPYAVGLIAAWIFNEASGSPVELVSQQPASSATGFTWTTGPDGPVGVFNGSTTDLTYSIPAVGPGISLAGSASLTDITANGILIERETINSTLALFMQSSSLIFRGGDSSFRYAFDIAPVVNNQYFSWCFTDPGGSNNALGYLNGAVQTNVNVGTGADVVSNTNPIHLGNYDNSGYFLGGTQSYIYVWNYAISSVQAAGIAANPYQIIPSLSAAKGGPPYPILTGSPTKPVAAGWV